MTRPVAQHALDIKRVRRGLLLRACTGGVLALGLAGGMLAMGGYCVFQFGWAHFERHRVGKWLGVPARIEWVGLREVGWTRKRNPRYETSARYTYAYAGRGYEGTRVRIEVSLPGEGDPSAKDRADELSKYKNSGEPFPARVNPARAEESILFVDLHPTCWLLLLFGLPMAGTGGVGLGYFVSVLRRLRRQSGRLTLHSDRPWRIADEWADGFSVRSNTAPALASWGAFFVLLLMLGGPVILFLILAGWPALVEAFSLWMLIVVALGLAFLLARAVYVTRVALKYGRSILELAEMPIIPGRRVAARVVCAQRIVPQGAFRVTVLNRVPKLGRSLPVPDYVESCDVSVNEVTYAPEDTRVPVTIFVPIEQQTSSLPFSFQSVSWALRIEAATPGVDFRAEFPLPVFAAREDLIERAPVFGNGSA